MKKKILKISLATMGALIILITMIPLFIPIEVLRCIMD